MSHLLPIQISFGADNNFIYLIFLYFIFHPVNHQSTAKRTYFDVVPCSIKAHDLNPTYSPRNLRYHFLKSERDLKRKHDFFQILIKLKWNSYNHCLIYILEKFCIPIKHYFSSHKIDLSNCHPLH